MEGRAAHHLRVGLRAAGQEDHHVGGVGDPAQVPFRRGIEQRGGQDVAVQAAGQAVVRPRGRVEQADLHPAGKILLAQRCEKAVRRERRIGRDDDMHRADPGARIRCKGGRRVAQELVGVVGPDMGRKGKAEGIGRGKPGIRPDAAERLPEPGVGPGQVIRRRVDRQHCPGGPGPAFRKQPAEVVEDLARHVLVIADRVEPAPGLGLASLPHELLRDPGPDPGIPGLPQDGVGNRLHGKGHGSRGFRSLLGRRGGPCRCPASRAAGPSVRRSGCRYRIAVRWTTPRSGDRGSRNCQASGRRRPSRAGASRS